MSRICRFFFLSALIVGTTLTLNSPTAAQKKAPPAVNAQAPKLATSAPLGMQRGTAADLTLTGANLAQPVGLTTSIPGAKVTIPTDGGNGTDAARLRVRLEVPKDAPLGYHALRLATAKGMSNVRLVCVDELPQVLSNEKNRAVTAPQAVPVPCVVIGKIANEAADYYKFVVQAGQRVSFDVLAHRLGSALDPQITLLDARRQRELPGGHNNDAPGLQTDARLSYQFAEAGEYIVEIRDTIYRGGDEYAYRLRIGDFPCATSPLPMAAKRGSKATVFFSGPCVDGVWPEAVEVPADASANVIWVAPRGSSGLHGWPVALAVSDHEELLETEPNNDRVQANRIPIPGGITAGFQSKGDIDYFTFTAKKGQRLVVESHSQELYSPCEVFMTVKDVKDAEVAKSNPTTPPRLTFSPAADGDYTLIVEHLFNWHGPSETYRITVTPQEPDFELTLASDRIDVPQAGTAVLALTAVRRDYNGPIDVSLQGIPGVTGHATLAAGQVAGSLLVSASFAAPVGPALGFARGAAVINGKTVTRAASVRPTLTQDLASLTYPPLQFNEQVAVAVTEKAPFVLTVHAKQTECYPGGAFPILVSAARVPGFTEEIALAAVDVPPTVTPALKAVPKGKNDIDVQLNATAKAALGNFPVFLSGKGKFRNTDYTVVAPLTLTVAPPLEIKVESAPLKLKPGEKAKLKVTALRKGGNPGPITVELKNLPAQVTANKITVAEKQDQGEIEVTAAPTAAVADKADVSAVAIATAAGNQQATSPAFTVSILKK